MRKSARLIDELKKKKKKKEKKGREISRADFNWLFHSRLEKKRVVKGNETNWAINRAILSASDFVLSNHRTFIPFLVFPSFSGRGVKKNGIQWRARMHGHTWIHTRTHMHSGVGKTVRTRACTHALFSLGGSFRLILFSFRLKGLIKREG